MSGIENEEALAELPSLFRFLLKREIAFGLTWGFSIGSFVGFLKIETSGLFSISRLVALDSGEVPTELAGLFNGLFIVFLGLLTIGFFLGVFGLGASLRGTTFREFANSVRSWDAVMRMAVSMVLGALIMYYVYSIFYDVAMTVVGMME